MGVLDGKVAIVTGSARGIGRATAELLCAEGASVLINDLDGDVAEQVASEIDGETAVFAGDLTVDGAPEALVSAAVDAFGRLDIVVNNAGYTWDGIAHRMSDEQFRAMLEIHTVVPFKVLRAAAPYLREEGKKDRELGREIFRKVVNITSISGTQGNVGQANYAAGKAGLIGVTKSLAREWGPFKVNVNASPLDSSRRGSPPRPQTAARSSATAARSSSASPTRCASSRRRSSRSGER